MARMNESTTAVGRSVVRVRRARQRLTKRRVRPVKAVSAQPRSLLMRNLRISQSSPLRSWRAEPERFEGRVNPRVPLKVPDPAINHDAVAIDQIIDGYGADPVLPGIDLLCRR